MENRVAVITGISKGIGKAIGNKFENESIKVVGFSRTCPQGKYTHWVQGDITVKEDRERLIKEVLSNYGRIDVLVNNAGVGLCDTWQETTENNLRRIFETNFFALIELTKLFIDDLIKTKGTIINVSSALGKIPVPCMGGYSATKFAINAFSDTLRIELKPQGVHVLNLVVGTTETDFLSNSLGTRKPPPTPGIGNPNVLAHKVYQAYTRGKKQITYPGWYAYLFVFVKLFPKFYEYMNIKQWDLK